MKTKNISLLILTSTLLLHVANTYSVTDIAAGVVSGEHGATAKTVAGNHTCLSYFTDKSPNSRYNISSNNGTALDTVTNLMWKRCSEGLSFDSARNYCTNNGSGPARVSSSYTWGNALKFNGSSFAGHSNWRLPNVKELMSLVKSSCTKPAINISIFPDIITPYASQTSTFFWTSTPSFSNNDRSWIVDFDYGFNTVNFDFSTVIEDKSFAKGFTRTLTNHVRLVRSTN